MDSPSTPAKSLLSSLEDLYEIIGDLGESLMGTVQLRRRETGDRPHKYATWPDTPSFVTSETVIHQWQALEASLYSSVAERQSCKLKVLGSIPSGGCCEAGLLHGYSCFMSPPNLGILSDDLNRLNRLNLPNFQGWCSNFTTHNAGGLFGYPVRRRSQSSWSSTGCRPK